MIRTAIEFLGQRLIGWLGLLGGSWRMVWGTALWTASHGCPAWAACGASP